ncbi:MAG: LysM peptidoglycan-binding domain-containing protein [Planctomycetota bacterium]|jgi:LysM repeat protein
MASEAKIGLLLGLVIVFSVAFVLNGLPHFGDTKQGDDLTKVVDSNPIGIRPVVPREVFAGGRTVEKPIAHSQLPIADSSIENQKSKIENSSEVFKLKPVRPAWPKVHVVRKGDSLADIAKRYYGPKEGNRRANVLRIFESNRSLLKSPDKIYPGQKLVIPSLWASGLGQKTIESIFPDSMFERVESIGRRHL